MDFNTNINGNTFLGRVLRSTPPQEQMKVLEMVDWNIPDTGSLPAPIRYEDWGQEIIYTHPLSTVASVCDEQVFRLALDLAHSRQKDRLYVKYGRREEPVIFSDWVATGVLYSVARFGSVGMLKDLFTKLDERSEITTDLSYPYRRREGVPCPYMGLAQTGEPCKEKLSTLLSNYVIQAQKSYIVSSPRAIKNIERQFTKSGSTLALSRAMLFGNTHMIDDVASLGKGPLGNASLTFRDFYEAISSRRFVACAHALSLTNWDETSFFTVSDTEPNDIAPIIRDVNRSATVLLHQMFPENLASVLAPETIQRHLSKTPPEDAHAIEQITKVVLRALIKCAPGTISENISSLPALINLPAADVESTYNDLLAVGLKRSASPLPDLSGWALMANLPATAWTDRVDQHMSTLSKYQVAEFVERQGVELLKYWKHHIDEGKEEALASTFWAVKRWWDVAPQSLLPASSAATWLNNVAKAMDEECCVIVNRMILNELAQTSQISKRPKSHKVKM